MNRDDFYKSKKAFEAFKEFIELYGFRVNDDDTVSIIEPVPLKEKLKKKWNGEKWV